MIHISLPESKLPTVMGGELSRNRLAFDGDVFLLGQLRFCFLLRDLQRQDAALQFGFDILFCLLFSVLDAVQGCCCGICRKGS